MTTDLSLPALPPGLRLSRPLAFFDLEATGLNKKTDRIVSVAILRYEPGAEAAPRRIYYLVNPTVPIPAEATAIHGISDADVADAPTFADLAPVVRKDLEGCDLGGYNILGYDIDLLCCEFARAGMEFKVSGRDILDVQRIYFKREPRTLSAALKFYCGEDHAEAHDAMGDAIATVEVLSGQFRRYGDLPTTVASLYEYSVPPDPSLVDRERKFRWQNGEVVLNFGKNSGRPLKDVARNEPGFLRWMLKADFGDEAKKIASDALVGRFPKPRGNA
ncbi:MAG: 3'-5' exonuclease [Kiritimatiellae bacterium]|nr:3'-5' exonuclease [Kiritimatiellia bacterium]